jgi:hypothetical protein
MGVLASADNFAGNKLSARKLIGIFERPNPKVDIKFDMQKKNEILVLVTPEHLSAVAADNGWQRHFQTAFEQVSDRCDPTNSRSSVLTAVTL